MDKKKTISVYLKGGRNAATSYYRFCQFFDKIDADFSYNLMIPDSHWNDFFPIAIQPFKKKVLIFFYIYFRVLKSLISDMFKKPDYLIISRCLINRVMPISYRLLLMILKKNGTKIIYDFDDQIISTKEIVPKNFDYLTNISNLIIIGSPLLGDLVKTENKDKILFLPTTDGDFQSLLSDNRIIKERLASFDNEIRIVWVGTFSGLKYLETVLGSIEKFGYYLGTIGKVLYLDVVCDTRLDYHSNSFILHNIKWSRQKAIVSMLEAHIGIMPLLDDEITRGKCSFKLIQYLSSGLPIVGTCVGMNKDVLDDRVGVGLSSNKIDNWYSAFIRITNNKDVWREYSKNALDYWKEKYSYQNNLYNWKSIFNQSH